MRFSVLELLIFEDDDITDSGLQCRALGGLESGGDRGERRDYSV